MEEKKDVMGLVDKPAPNSPWWQSGFIKKLQMISLGYTEETSSSKGQRTENDLRNSAFKRALHTLWDTGKLAEPIPDGFYFVTPERRFKELFDTIPPLDELYTLETEGLRPNVIVVDARKDKKLSMLKQLAVTLVKGLNSNPTAMVKKIAGLVCDFYKRPKLCSDHLEVALEEVSHVLDNQGIHLLGQIKHGSCHSRAILFKVLGDTVGLDSRLMLGLPNEGVMGQTDSYNFMSAIVVINSVELLVDLVHSPGKLIPSSTKSLFLSHLSTGESDSAENNSYDSPVEPSSPLHGVSDQVDVESLYCSEPYIPNSFWRRSRKKVAEQRTASSSPEHPLIRGHGRSLLGSGKISFREYNNVTSSRSAGTSPVDTPRRRRRCISMVPEIGDDIVSSACFLVHITLTVNLNQGLFEQ